MKKLGAVGPTDFDRTTAVVPIDDRPGEFAVELDVGWSSLVGMHGGYMCAIAVNGAEALVDDRTVRTLTTSFLRTGQVGPATLSVRVVRGGRSFSTMVADLLQDGRLLLTTRLTLMVDREGVEWQTPTPMDLPAPEECARMEGGRGFTSSESTASSIRAACRSREVTGPGSRALYGRSSRDWLTPPGSRWRRTGSRRRHSLGSNRRRAV